MENENLYPIKYVALRTNLPAYTIRTWENRYEAVTPARSRNNRRLYCNTDIQRLQLLKRAVDIGYSISQIANFPLDKLLTITEKERSAATKFTAKQQSQTPKADLVNNKLLQHIVNVDYRKLEADLDDAAVRLTKLDLIIKVLCPLHDNVAELVQNKFLANLHFNVATTVIRAFMWDLLRTAAVSEHAPRIVTATPKGQSNEINALALALISVEAGWRPIYSGPNLPAKDIVETVESKQAQAAALSVSIRNDKSKLKKELIDVQHFLDDTVGILICDNGKALRHYIRRNNVFITKLKNFRQTLEGMTLENLN
jgi:DNA-binding transcriptional MerR regulator